MKPGSHLGGDEDLGGDGESAQAAQRVEAAAGLRGGGAVVLSRRVGRLLGGLERLQQLPLHGGHGGGGIGIKTLAAGRLSPPRAVSFGSEARRGGEKGKKRLDFEG
jgi:hypothetical protein